MTGTSLDGLDVVLAEVTASGLAMKGRFLGMVSLPLGDLREQLHHFASGRAAPPIEYMRAARRLGGKHAEAVAELCQRHLPSGAKLDFVVVHGQTIWHAPQEHVSWQLFDPWPIVRRLNVPVCYDLRQSDLIAGGQGAPITPLADWVLYRHASSYRIVANLGGICNLTHLRADAGPDAIRGEDWGPCNLFIDGVVHALFPGQPFDRDGRLASEGRADAGVIQQMRQQVNAVKTGGSLGREIFSDTWVRALVPDFSGAHLPHDILASAVETVVDDLLVMSRQYVPDELVLAGGGAKNRYLVRRLRDVHVKAGGGDPVRLSDDMGIPCQAREAMGFAVLGALSQDGVPITRPTVTGAKDPQVAGVWAYP